MKRFMSSGAGIILILLLITNFLNGGMSDPKTYFFNMLLTLPAIIIGLSFHEFGHAFTSYKLGDPTPKMQGRVTLDPFAHFDPFGFLALVFCGFGWGKPVQIDPRYYKHPRRDEFLVSLAGVVMNLLLAVLFAFIVRIYIKSTGAMTISTDNMQGIILTMLVEVIIINLMLAVFNIIPIPPLDGFGVVTELFNIKKTQNYYKFYNNGFVILMLLLMFGVIDKIIYPAVNGLYGFLFKTIVL